MRSQAVRAEDSWLKILTIIRVKNVEF